MKKGEKVPKQRSFGYEKMERMSFFAQQTFHMMGKLPF